MHNIYDNNGSNNNHANNYSDDITNEDSHVNEIEEFKRKRFIAWCIRASGWGILAIAVLFYIYDNHLMFTIGEVIGITTILVSFIYSFINQLFVCPCCGGHIFKNKCLNCGRIWVAVHK